MTAAAMPMRGDFRVAAGLDILQQPGLVLADFFRAGDALIVYRIFNHIDELLRCKYAASFGRVFRNVELCGRRASNFWDIVRD